MEAKTKHRQAIVEHLASPDNDFCTNRSQLAECIGISRQRLYELFSAAELAEIEAEALDVRRKKYTGILAKVDTALLDKASSGDVQAIKLCYQRFEGWTEKTVREHRNVTVEDIIKRIASNHYPRIDHDDQDVIDAEFKDSK